MNKEKLQEILLDFLQVVWEKEDMYYDANNPKWHVKLVDDFIKEEINLSLGDVSNGLLHIDNKNWEDVISGYSLDHNLNDAQEWILDDLIRYLNEEYKDTFNGC